MTARMVWDAIGWTLALGLAALFLIAILWHAADCYDRLRFWLRECAVRRQIRRDHRRYGLQLQRYLALSQRTDADYIQPLLPPRSFK